MGGEKYTDPRFDVDQALCLGRLTPTVSGDAEEEIARFRFFTKVKVKEIRATIKVAGKAATSAFTVLKGTSSIGAVVLGTNAAGSVVDASLVDADFDATDDLVLQNLVATDTASAMIGVHYQQRFYAG